MKKNSIYQMLSFGAVGLAFILLVNAAAVQAETITVVGKGDAAQDCGNRNKADDNLRSAICYYNSKEGDAMTDPLIGSFTGHIIELPAGTYALNRSGAGEDANSTGDLDINLNTTFPASTTLLIIGQTTGAIIDAGALDRAFHILRGKVIFRNVTIRNGSTDFGGGIRNQGGDVTLEGCTLTTNTATDKGGGFHNSSGTTLIANSIIESNTTVGSGTHGGGMSVYAGTVRLTNSSLKNNTAANSGGGIYVYDGGPTVVVERSTISGNRARGSGTGNGLGGGIYQTTGTVTLTNSTVSGNTARLGGGVYLNKGNFTLNHGTVSNNTASVDAGGIRISDQNIDAKAMITNSIIALNTDSTAGDYPDVYGSLTTNEKNIIGVLAAGDLQALGNNGGSTETHALTPNTASYTNPAINYIPYNTSGCGSTYITDQRSYTRPSPSGENCDAGAFEVQEATGGVLGFAGATTVAENGYAKLQVTRTGGLSQAVDVTVSITAPTSGLKLVLCNPASYPTTGAACTSATGSTSITFTIPVGYASVEFYIVGIDNTSEDGHQAVTLEVAETDPDIADGVYSTGSTIVTVTDNETVIKLLLIKVQPARITEGRSATVVVTCSDAVADLSVPITLTSGSSTDLKVGGHVNASQTITTTDGVATFTVYAQDDGDEIGLEAVTLTAAASGYTSAAATVFIRDSGAISGGTLTFPSFVLHASYDWLHNFYDNNQEAIPSSTNPLRKHASDNFNKLIMIDSNLFPIYTALQGDAEMPNVTMRNWTSGVGIYSPSVNDYMNRSVAAAADYINVTSKIPFGYGATDSLDAVGMRSHLQWVYALDPANHNFRRYKFVKINDSVPDVPYWDSSMNTGFIDKSNDPNFGGTTDNQGIECATCDPNYWYVVNYDQSINAYDNKCPESCYDTNSDGEADIKFLMYAKKQAEGMTDTGINPPVRFQVPVSAQTIDTQSTVDVSMELKGFKTASDAEMSFILNADSVESTCQQTTKADTDLAKYGLNNGGCGSDNGSCRMVVNISFEDVPTSCASNCNSQYCYMTIDMTPLDKNHGGWFIELPNYEPPKEKDNAFRIPVVGFDNITGAEWDMLTETEKQKKIETRWGNIGGYLDLMPPRSYPGYVNYTARVGYGYQTNTTFSSADNVRFKDPRDIAVYRDYFDQANGGPVYIFVADTSNSRIQVFMNATGAAGDPGAAFPVRPVPVKAPNDNSAKTYYKSNELGMRIYSSNGDSVRFGDGRKADWRQYTTLPALAASDTFINISAGKGEFFYPHSIAVDQDPDTKDVYLFVADTYNHRIQVFRDVSGVSSQAITAKKFNFEFEAGLGTYPLQTSEFMTDPGAYNFRYPKGLSVARFHNNSSYLYVADSKNYRLMKYAIGEDADGISGIEAVGGYGFNGTYNSDGSPRFVKDLHESGEAGKPLIKHVDGPGFWNPQDVAAGYSGFFIYTSPHGRGVKFLNNYMVYVTDYARNMTSITANRLNTRVMQFIEVPGVYKSISGAWIPWQTEVYSTTTTLFPKGTLGQSVYGITDGVYKSIGTGESASKSSGSSGNVPGRKEYFTDRPVGITALQWNTLKPIDIRVIKADGSAAYLPGQALPLTTPLRIGVSSRKLSFGYPENNPKMFIDPSSTYGSSPNVRFVGYSSDWTELTGRWDATDAGRVHLFCYDKTGKYIAGSHKWVSALNNKGVLFTPPFLVTLQTLGCTNPGFVKIVVEDKDFNASARTGTAFYGVGQ